jgi:hypothetical protein
MGVLNDNMDVSGAHKCTCSLQVDDLESLLVLVPFLNAANCDRAGAAPQDNSLPRIDFDVSWVHVASEEDGILLWRGPTFDFMDIGKCRILSVVIVCDGKVTCYSQTASWP